MPAAHRSHKDAIGNINQDSAQVGEEDKEDITENAPSEEDMQDTHVSQSCHHHSREAHRKCLYAANNCRVNELVSLKLRQVETENIVGECVASEVKYHKDTE